MAKITLDSIREAVNAKYDSTEIDLGGGVVVSLRNPLRLQKDERRAMVAAFDEFKSDSEEDQTAQLAKVIEIAAEDKAAVKQLVEAIGDDLAMYAEILEAYTSGVQVGEA